ncbi:MAG: thioredoxin domain-containing protein [Thermoleophilia bacterium]|nr:thioredoxin domain-containing protein [Thermoleophilia bacterium]
MSNHLAGETSPYLLAHATNPVEWYPWGPEAFERARAEDKPVFLSIGYSACHWCHVMERESFTDSQTAEFLNAQFVSVKVDREERPDLDAIYMKAVTTLTGRGGWPLSVWLTPDGAPFYGGTYFPPTPRFGMAPFRQVLDALAKLWVERRDELQRAAAELRRHLSEEGEGDHRGPLGRPILTAANDGLHRSFDPAYGGWGEAPKFPQPLVLEYLLAQWAVNPEGRLQVHIERTLDAMATGGVYDHLGGGFHRYSTDERWLVPHFEKMLYDNAQLARCYLHAWQLTGKTRYREVAEETLDYLLGRMAHPQGGFFSSEDADSEGVEGAFYVWSADEIDEILGPDAAEGFKTEYGVTREGNFEGATILHLPLPEDGEPDRAAEVGAELAGSRAKLFAAREKRARPARDEKVVAAWNGLALAAFAEAARALGSDRYRAAAEATGAFVAEELVRSGDRLAHSWKDGHATGNGFLDDYACVVEGLLALYQSTFNERWFKLAAALTEAMVRHFRRSAGGFYDTSDDHETLVVRPRSLQDSPTPSGNALAATVLLKMWAFTGEAAYLEHAEATLATAAGLVGHAPVMFGQWLLTFLLADTGLTEVAVVGEPADPQREALLSVLDEALRPATVAAARPPGSHSSIPLLEGREPAAKAGATAWVCRQSTCSAPAGDPPALRALLDPTRS